MRKFAFLAILAVLAVAVTASASAGSCAVAVDYAADGFEGLLAISDAEGKLYTVFDVYGGCMAEGVATSDDFEVPCPNSGPDCAGVLLHVAVGGNHYAIGDRDDDWHWD